MVSPELRLGKSAEHAGQLGQPFLAIHAAYGGATTLSLHDEVPVRECGDLRKMRDDQDL